MFSNSRRATLSHSGDKQQAWADTGGLQRKGDLKNGQQCPSSLVCGLLFYPLTWWLALLDRDTIYLVVPTQYLRHWRGRARQSGTRNRRTSWWMAYKKSEWSPEAGIPELVVALLLIQESKACPMKQQRKLRLLKQQRRVQPLLVSCRPVEPVEIS